MPPSMFVTFVAVALLALLAVASAERDGLECDAEDAHMVQVFGRKLNSKRLGSCRAEDQVRWPCGTPVVSSFALQVVNNDTSSSNCAADNVATISALNIDTGDYASICQLPEGICVNACGIDPTSNLAFCVSRPGDLNLLRIDCDFTGKLAELQARSDTGTLSSFTPVAGDVCFYGLVANTMQGAFDASGNFWFLRSTGRVYQITDATIGMLSGAANPTVPRSPPIQGAVAGQEFLISAVNVGNVADIVAITSDFEGTSQEYLVGCFRDSTPNRAKVWVQQVSGVTNPTNPPLPIELSITNADPAGSSGATWSFQNRIFCAYNNVDQGVYEPLLATAFDIDIAPEGDRRHGFVEVARRISESVETRSNDGMNCINALAPFPPFPSTTTSTTALGAGEGDPHIHTLDGRHYLLLSQGSFSFWRYSGVDAELQSKKAPVDFEVFAHYSGHSSYTKGLLLVDRSGASSAKASHQIMELTAEDCRWRAKTRDGSWQLVDKPALLALGEDGDEMTAFNMARSKGQKMHVEFLMKSGAESFKNIGTLYATCKPYHHINMKMAMFSQDNVHLVKGQLGPHGNKTGRGYRNDRLPAASLLETMGQELSMDQDFLTKKDWTELGGSASANAYLKQVDEEGVALLQSCSKEAAGAARATCSKFLGSPPGPQESLTGRAATLRETFEDCVFDVCAGGGEAAAELAAEIMNAF